MHTKLIAFLGFGSSTDSSSSLFPQAFIFAIALFAAAVVARPGGDQIGWDVDNVFGNTQSSTDDGTAGSFYMALDDGSVERINYAINADGSFQVNGVHEDEPPKLDV